MPHLFRTADGKEWKPGRPFPVSLTDGTTVAATWGGCAQNEKLSWWLRKPGHEISRSAEISGIAIKAEDTGELRWGDAPAGVAIFFVLEPERVAKSGEPYRLAKMVTTAATPEQFAYFRDEQFALFGQLDREGVIQSIAPLPPPDLPPPALPSQGELF